MGRSEEGRPALRCLGCKTTVAPVNKWEQCACGNLFVDTSLEGTVRYGYADVEKVKQVGEKLVPTGDEFTTSKMMEGNG